MRTRQRVADYGEVFTPAWLVNDMLDLVKDESERIDSRFLEPACGSGNFLVAVLGRKLATVQRRYGASEFERRHYALLALMCLYGIELLADNTAECRANLLAIFSDFLGDDAEPLWARAAQRVLELNIVNGDALKMTTAGGQPITFCEWAYLGRGRYQRRDFRYDTLTQLSSFGSDTLFGSLEPHDIFTPTRDFPPLSVEEIAR